MTMNGDRSQSWNHTQPVIKQDEKEDRHGKRCDLTGEFGIRNDVADLIEQSFEHSLEQTNEFIIFPKIEKIKEAIGEIGFEASIIPKNETNVCNISIEGKEISYHKTINIYI